MSNKLASGDQIRLASDFYFEDLRDMSPEADALARADPATMHAYNRIFAIGLSGVFESARVHQPLVHAVAMNAGPIFGFGWAENNKNRIKPFHIGFEISGCVVVLHPFSKMSDPRGISAKPRQVEKFDFLPAAIRDVYFDHFCGMSFVTISDIGRLQFVPTLVNPRESWQPIDETLALAGKKKEGLSKLLDVMPDLAPEPGDIWRKMYTVINSSWPITNAPSDAWSVHFRSEDRPSQAYLMNDYEVSTLSEVIDFAGRLDTYVSNKLLSPDRAVNF